MPGRPAAQAVLHEMMAAAHSRVRRFYERKDERVRGNSPLYDPSDRSTEHDPGTAGGRPSRRASLRDDPAHPGVIHDRLAQSRRLAPRLPAAALSLLLLYYYVRSVSPAGRARTAGPRAYADAGRDRVVASVFELLAAASYVVYFFCPLPVPLPRTFPWPWPVSILVAVLIGIPACALMVEKTSPNVNGSEDEEFLTRLTAEQAIEYL
jgi:hypothetical protein